jgi:Amidohydrolase family
MHKFLNRAWVTLLCALSVQVAYAYSREDFVVKLASGEVCGHHVVEYLSAQKIKVHYQCLENGRGDNLFEEMTLAPNGDLTHYQVSGESEMGGKIHEQFDLKAGLARWKSASEEGEQRVAGHAFYVPMNSTFAVNSLMITQLNQQKSKKLNLIPSGELTQHVLFRTTLRRAHQSTGVQLLMLSGIGLKPDFFWATTGKTPKFFAFISPGYSMFLKEWEPAMAKLQRVQDSLTDRLLESRAREIQHPLKGLLLIKNASLFDSLKGGLTSLKHVYVEDGRILKILDSLDPDLKPQHVIDATDQVLLPGLFDMHAHINAWSGTYHMANGVTTVRDMGNQNKSIQQMMEQIKAGQLLAPTILPAGLIEGKSEFASSDGILIASLEEAQQAVDYYAQAGYHHIKIYSSFPKAFVKELVQYAHNKGLTVGGHVPAFMSSKEAILSGFNEINHMNQLLLYLVSSESTDTRTIERFYLPAEKFLNIDLDSPEVRELIELLKSRHITVDPTLAGFDFLKQRDGEISEPFQTIYDHMPIDIQRSFRVGAMKIPDDETALRYKKSYQKMVEFTARLYREGVSLVAGTDTFAGFGLHSELALYVKAGLTPTQAIQMATYHAAEITGTVKDRGSIEEGKLADLILVQGHPTENIEDLRKISVVLTRGYAVVPNEIFNTIHVKPFIETPSRQW